MAFLELKGLQKQFGDLRVVKDFNLNIEQGEFVSFLGPSGCGKTTVLRMVAGFEEPTAGTISVGGKNVTNLKTSQRDMGMVFQAYALFPNMTVAQNIGFGLKVRGASSSEISNRVTEMLKLIQLDALADRYPYQMSGGQQQRVALARALAPQPKVLLLDEPLSALDAKVRVSLRDEIRAIQKRLGITTIFVTHDQEEALSISDRIIVMYQGIAEQVATPFEIYNRPATKFVANFVGTLNVLDGTVADADKGVIKVADGKVTLKGKLGQEQRNGTAVSLALRPEAIALGDYPGHDQRLDGTIADVQFLGAVIRVKVAIGSHVVSLDTFNKSTTPPPQVGQPAFITFIGSDVLVL